MPAENVCPWLSISAKASGQSAHVSPEGFEQVGRDGEGCLPGASSCERLSESTRSTEVCCSSCPLAEEPVFACVLVLWAAVVKRLDLLTIKFRTARLQLSHLKVAEK